jgi:hypothetical protein
MAQGDSAIDAGLVVGSITGEGGKRSWDLVEQGLYLRAIIDLTGCQFRRKDLPSVRIDADVQFSLSSPPPSVVLLDQPLAGSAESQTCAINQQVNGFAMRNWSWHLQDFGAAAQCRVIGHSQIQAEEVED